MSVSRSATSDSWGREQFARVNNAFDDAFTRSLRVHIGYRLIGINELGPFGSLNEDFIKLTTDPMWHQIQVGVRDSNRRRNIETSINRVVTSIRSLVGTHEQALGTARRRHQEQQAANEAARRERRLDDLERKQAEQDETLEELEERARKAEEEAEAARREIERLRRQRGF